MSAFAQVAPFLSHPLVLIGFVLLLFFGIHRTLIRSGIIPPLSRSAGSRIVTLLLRYGFVIALLTIAAGFAAHAWGTYLDNRNDRYKVSRFIAGMDTLSHGVDAAQKLGGLIIPAHTPADFYHNARIYMLNGDVANTLESFRHYFASDQPFIDPHYIFQDFLRNTSGLAETRRYYARLLQDHPNTPLYAFCAARLDDPIERVGAYETLLRSAPSYLPAIYELSREYSRATIPGQTLDDKRHELQYLSRFNEVNGDNTYLKYFLDKETGLKAIDDVAERYRSAREFNLDAVSHPVSVTAEAYGKGDVSIMIEPQEPTSAIWYKLDTMKDFQSTGSMGVKDPQTGAPLPAFQVPVGVLAPGTHRILVKYKDSRGVVVGPVDCTVAVPRKVDQDLANFIANQWRDSKGARFRDESDEFVLDFAWCSTWDETEASYFRNIRFSLDNPRADRYLVREGKRVTDRDNDFLELKLPALKPGPHRLFCAIDFIDGTKAMLRYDLAIKHDGAYHDAGVAVLADVAATNASVAAGSPVK